MLPPIITRARARLMARAPFFGALALGLDWIAEPGLDTMATDGRAIFYNPGWCAEIGTERTAAVIAHEVLHIVLKHHLRRGARLPGLWNIAADFAINATLLKDGFVLPDDLLIDHAGRFTGLPAEAIYERLLQEQPTRPAPAAPDVGPSGPGATSLDAPASSGPAGEPRWGQVRDLTQMDGSPLPESRRRQAGRDLDVRIRQAAAMARRAGKLPSTLVEMIAAGAPRIDWRDRFRQVFDGTRREALDWGRPNRRFLPHGLYLPGWRRSGAGVIAFVLDTSGSISPRELAAYTAEVLGILEETSPDRIVLIQCDTAVCRVEDLRPGEGFDSIEVEGRGGTKFQPAFDWIATNLPQAAAIVYATDLAAADEPVDPGIPTIWLTPTRGRSVGFGEVVERDLT
ncbi:vWA domain-containing protein [Rhodovastum atsumiense]|nr:VWA-like domain-containing protein [Rhodovastum atsumiense]